MSWNSIPSYSPDTLRQIQESSGITQFPDGSSWYQIIQGLYIQGSAVDVLINSSTVIPFEIAIPTQLLGIFLTPVIAGVGNGYGAIDPAGTNLTQFTLVNTGAAKSYYWWAIGV